MNADLNSTLVFACVVQSSSFSRAAERLGVPVSTVSRRVSELEKQLGVRLIERSTRRLRVTAVGSEIFEHAERISHINDSVVNIVSNHLPSVSGSLRISVPSTLTAWMLTPVVARFQDQYPDVHVQVFVTDRLVDQMEEGIDLAFRVGPLEDSSLIVHHLVSYRHRLVASPAYLKERETPPRPEDLRGHRLVAYWLSDSNYIWDFSRAENAQRQSVHFEPHLSVNNYLVMASALISGAGVGELPPMIGSESLCDGRLVEVMPEWRFEPVDMSLVHLRGQFVSRAARLFKETTVELIPSIVTSQLQERHDERVLYSFAE